MICPIVEAEAYYKHVEVWSVKSEEFWGVKSEESRGIFFFPSRLEMADKFNRGDNGPSGASRILQAVVTPAGVECLPDEGKRLKVTRLLRNSMPCRCVKEKVCIMQFMACPIYRKKHLNF